MKITWSLFLFIIFLIVSESVEATDQVENHDGVYIVYMGAASPTNGLLRDDHIHLLNSNLGKRNAVVHTYKHGFTGFAAHLSKEEADSMAEKPGVISVFPDQMLNLHTTRSWDFLMNQSHIKIDSIPQSDHSKCSSHGSDTIIGILDTGIWPESESFDDKDMDPIPSRWKGTCMVGDYFNSSNCNRKIIGARYYGNYGRTHVQHNSARDTVGHGTHVAATAAGSTVASASYYGLAAGRAKGGAPWSRIAMYRVCSPYGCPSAAILAAFDDAIADGVHVLSLSLGATAYMRPHLLSDPIAIGAFHAVENGIIVVCSAGNDGPSSGTVVNVVPWILTVAASSIDRDFESDLVLGTNKVIKGGGINFSALQKSPQYPLVLAKSIKAEEATEFDARNCIPDSMDESRVKGKIVVCGNDDETYTPSEKVEGLKRVGGVGIVFVDDKSRAVAEKYGSFPSTAISSKDAVEVHSYINSTRNPVATILPTVTVTGYKPAPAIAYFSSRGPSPDIRNILKPDISAPGVNILAAWMGNYADVAPDKTEPLFNVISGTSMACPHVSGIAATVKSQNPKFSPSAIKSAIMTTAFQINNLGAPITTDSGSIATPYEYGAGEVTTSEPSQPGLVYETSTSDYLNYLCYSGCDVSTIKKISHSVPVGFACPKDSSADHISNINYPSIALHKFNVKKGKKISRTVTNVGGDGETVYTVSVDSPSEVSIKVIPEKLHFERNNEKQSFKMIFSSTVSSLKGDLFGSITWSNGKYNVRSPFVVSS